METNHLKLRSAEEVEKGRNCENGPNKSERQAHGALYIDNLTQDELLLLFLQAVDLRALMI